MCEGCHVWALGRHVALEPLKRVGLATLAACTPSLLPELLVGARLRLQFLSKQLGCRGCRHVLVIIRVSRRVYGGSLEK